MYRSPTAPSTHYNRGFSPLTKREAVSSKPQECHICLEALRTHLVACPCGHVYHDDCITKALNDDRRCPLCRSNTTPNQLIRLFLEVPEPIASSMTDLDSQVAVLNKRLWTTMERLQYETKRYEHVDDEAKRSQLQVEKLIVENQTLLHRVDALEASNQELLRRVAKCYVELSRQPEAPRQVPMTRINSEGGSFRRGAGGERHNVGPQSGGPRRGDGDREDDDRFGDFGHRGGGGPRRAFGKKRKRRDRFRDRRSFGDK